MCGRGEVCVPVFVYICAAHVCKSICECVTSCVCVRRRSACLPVWGSPGNEGFPLQHQRWRGARAYAHTHVRAHTRTHTLRVFLSLMPKQREEKTTVRCWEISSIKIVRAFSTGTFPHTANTQKWQVTRPGKTSQHTHTHTHETVLHGHCTEKTNKCAMQVHLQKYTHTLWSTGLITCISQLLCYIYF